MARYDIDDLFNSKIPEAIELPDLGSSALENIDPNSIGTGEMGNQFDNLGLSQNIITVQVGDDIQKAIDKLHILQGGLVLIKDGTHKLDANLTMYSNVYLEGETSHNAILDFIDNTHGIVASGSNDYSTGTVSISNNSTTLTGSGTSWSTNVVAGMYVLLAGIWYPVASVGSDTSITLSIPFADVALSGASYVAAVPIDDIKITNITVTNASTGVAITYCSRGILDDVNVNSSVTGISIVDSSLITNNVSTIVACNTGYTLTRMHFTQFLGCSAINPLAGNGYTLTGVTNSSFINSFVLNASADGMNITSCENSRIDGVFAENGGQGVEFVSGNNNIVLSLSRIMSNASDGIKLTATSDNIFIQNIFIKDNGGYGVNVAASTDDNTVIVGNNFSGNSSGAVSDSGTGTLIRGNVGVDDNGASGSPSITKVYRAGEAISAMDAVYVDGIGNMSFDNSDLATVTGSTLSYTVTGIDPYLLVAVYTTTDTVTAVTYAGTAMTLIGKTTYGHSTYGIAVYGLADPTTGSNNISVTYSSGSGYIGAYSAKETHGTQPDVYDTGSVTANTTHSLSVTTVTDNDWLVMFHANNFGVLTAGANTVSLESDSSTGNNILYSNGRQSPPGSFSQTGTTGSATNSVSLVVALKPLQSDYVRRCDASAAGTANGFIGFATSAIAQGAEGQVIISGEVTLSGLTIGSQYYLSDTTGAIGTSAGTVTRKVGIATSTTKLLITNIW